MKLAVISLGRVGLPLVLDLIKKIFIDKQYLVEILGDGEQVRAYTHVIDLAEAIANFGLYERSDKETFNVANPKAYTVKELAPKIWEIGPRLSQQECRSYIKTYLYFCDLALGLLLANSLSIPVGEVRK